MRYEEFPRTVHFGRGLLSGAAGLLSEAFDGVFVIATNRLSRQVEALCEDLGSRHAHTKVGATMHVPVSEVGCVVQAFDSAGARSVLAVGGGSAIGLGKALARRRGVPLAAIPTTYAGSEMTSVWGETRDGVKTTGRDEAARPREVVYDVDLTETMSRAASVASAFNALAHSMEALYAPDSTPVSDAIAKHSIGQLCAAVSAFSRSSAPVPEARESALRGAWLAGQVLGSTTMSMHHKLCHILGGSCNLPHAETHAVLLPNVLATCKDDAPDVYRTFCDALGSPAPDVRLREIAAAVRTPTSLKEIGITAGQLEQVELSLRQGEAQRHYAFDSAKAVAVLRSAWGTT